MTRICRALVLASSLLLLAACALPSPPTPEAAGPVTFNREIVRLLQQHCQVCHRPGEGAPFSLTTYQDAYARLARPIAARDGLAASPPALDGFSQLVPRR
jgi:hypothetical protein